MTRPVRHTRHEIRNAAEVARDLRVAVRLEKDGAITFLPDIHDAAATWQVDMPVSPETVETFEQYEAWRDGRDGGDRGA